MPGQPENKPLLHPAAPRNSFGCSAIFLFFLFLIIAGLGWFYSACATQIVVQQRRLAAYTPTQAVITQAEVRESRGSKGRTNYHAYIAYAYTVGGTAYTYDRIYPGEDLPVVGDFLLSSGRHYRVSSNPNRAGHSVSSLLAQYTVGKAVTVYHDPATPSRAFLVRQTHRLPYYLSTIAAIALWVMLAALVSAVRAIVGGQPAAVVPADETFECPAPNTLRSSCVVSLSFIFFFYVFAIPLLAHRVWVGGLAIWEWAMLAGIGLFIFWQFNMTRLAIRRYRMLEDATLSVFPGVARVGEPVGAVFAIRTRQPVKPEKVTVTVKCTVTEGKKTEEPHKAELEFPPSRELGAGEEFRVETSIDLPAGLPGSINKSNTKKTVLWTVDVVVTFSNCPEYSARFPLYVESSGGGGAAADAPASDAPA